METSQHDSALAEAVARTAALPKDGVREGAASAEGTAFREALAQTLFWFHQTQHLAFPPDTLAARLRLAEDLVSLSATLEEPLSGGDPHLRFSAFLALASTQ